LILFGGLLTVLLNINQFTALINSQNELTADAMIALQSINKAMLGAGYVGCRPLSNLVIINNSEQPLLTLSRNNRLQLFHRDKTHWNEIPPPILSNNQLAETDAFITRGLNTNADFMLEPMQNKQELIIPKSLSLKANSTLIVTDCSAGDLFTAAEVITQRRQTRIKTSKPLPYTNMH
jgi:hypothetical protein